VSLLQSTCHRVASGCGRHEDVSIIGVKRQNILRRFILEMHR
jgi:hypothetical protein